MSSHISDYGDEVPLMDTFQRALSNSHSSSPPLSLSPPLTSTSSPGTLKQYAFIFLAVCVVGYLCIVYFELSPVSPTELLSHRDAASGSCHSHFHNGVDDPFTLDERIDLNFYRSLKLAIEQGDEEQSASIARELTRSYLVKLRTGPQQQLPYVRRPPRSGPAAGSGPRKRGPTAEELKQVAVEIDREVAAVLNNRTLAQWDAHYAKESRYKGYIRRWRYHLGEGFAFSAPGCEPLGEQCSVPGGRDAAIALCNTLDACLGFTCNTGRSDCQLRVAPLVHDQVRINFNSFYKSSLAVASADVFVTTRMRKETRLLAPGSTAAPDFNFSAPCSATFKCVITYGLYGSSPKYGQGAVDNVRLCPSVFPGWKVRVYHDDSVPKATLELLVKEGAELRRVDTAGMNGDIAGMFWRFLVAEDDTVQRYMVRDSDSRLNPREAAAVADWMQSGFSVHSLRDHPNHDRPLNGGMWGGVRGSVKNVRALMMESERSGYGADLVFLNDKVWPDIKWDQLSHDSYSCEKYVNSRPFPTKRPADYQHVGQVFEDGRPRIGDITCCLENNPAPLQCRKQPDWLYG